MSKSGSIIKQRVIMQDNSFCLASTSHTKKYHSLDALVQAAGDKLLVPIHAWLESYTSAPSKPFPLWNKTPLSETNDLSHSSSEFITQEPCPLMAEPTYLCLIGLFLELQDLFTLMKACKSLYFLLKSPRMTTYLWERFLPNDVTPDDLSISVQHFLSCQRKKFHWQWYNFVSALQIRFFEKEILILFLFFFFQNSELNYLSNSEFPRQYSKERFLLPKSGWYHFFFLIHIMAPCPSSKIEVGLVQHIAGDVRFSGTEHCLLQLGTNRFDSVAKIRPQLSVETIQKDDKTTTVSLPCKTGSPHQLSWKIEEPFCVEMAVSATEIKFKTQSEIYSHKIQNGHGFWTVFGQVKIIDGGGGACSSRKC